jgi:hypothetical protein
MDLGTVRARYLDSSYVTAEEMREDIELAFSNAIHYNPRGHAVYRKAVELLKLLGDKYEDLVASRRNGTNGGDRKIAAVASVNDDRQTLPRIGKRHSIPKTIFEPEHRSKNARLQGKMDIQGFDFNSPFPFGSFDGKFKKMKKMPEGAMGNDITALRAQVMEMSKSLTSFGQTMANSSALSINGKVHGTMPVPQKPQKIVTTGEIVRLTRQVEDLPPEALSGVVKVIESGGYKLLQDDEGQVELDFEILDYDTIQKLKKLCQRHRQSFITRL